MQEAKTELPATIIFLNSNAIIRLCLKVKELLVEESNVQPVNIPVTVSVFGWTGDESFSGDGPIAVLLLLGSKQRTRYAETRW